MSGTEVVATATAEQLTNLQLGEPEVAIGRCRDGGDAHAEDERAAIATLRRILIYLPDNAAQEAPLAAPLPPSRPAEDPLHRLPVERKQGYAMRPILEAIFDAGTVLKYGR